MDKFYEILFNYFKLTCMYKDKNSIHLQEFEELKNKFESQLNDNLLKDFRYLLSVFESHLLSIRDEECKDVMYSCLKIGMECQEYLDKRHE